MKRYDTQPSFLGHSFPGGSKDEPAQKKAKLSESTDGYTTIAKKLSHGSYATLSHLRQDASRVSKELATGIRSAEKPDGQTSGRPSVDDLKRIQRITALEDLVKQIVDKESQYEVAQQDGVKQGLANGHSAPQAAASRSGTVLTLFGNAPTPKQLFSSMQHSADVKQDPEIKVELPVAEMGLPNGLTATNIMPSGAGETKTGPTFEESFAPPYSLATLHPPRNHKRSSTKDINVTWEFKDPVTRGSKRGGYTTQSLITGEWLSYGGVDPGQGASALQEKRKQRDRALSGTEAVQTAPTKAMLEDELAREEDALFRRAYSSFAPTHDDMKALIPAETKSMAWFAKLGNRRFNEVFGRDPALADESSTAEMAIDPALLEPANDKAEDFGRIIEELESLPEDAFEEKPWDKTDPELVLREIAELLETLASHQRIRNAALPSSNPVSRTPISPAPTLASRIGRPDSPAEDEVSTYEKLRREIAYLVLRLPPYALAKLDGEQLGDLGVSTLLPFQNRDYKGSMEEDQVSRQAKYTAAATAAGLASLTRQSSSTAGQHYSSTSSRTPAIGAAANTRYGQTSQMPGKTPATAPAYGRSMSGQPGSYGTPTAAPRQQYQSSQYARPSAAQQNSYGQANGQQYYGQSRPQQTPGTYGYGQTYGQTQQQRPAYSSSQPLQQFQQRAATYQPGPTQQPQSQSPYKRTASPAIPQPQSYAPPAQQPRPAYNPSVQPQQYGQPPQPGSGRATPSLPHSGPQTPVNGLPRAPPPAPVPRAASGTPQPLAMAPQKPPMQQPAPPQQQQTQQSMTNGHS